MPFRGITERGSASASAGRPWQTAPWDADDPKGRRAGRTRPEKGLGDLYVFGYFKTKREENQP